MRMKESSIDIIKQKREYFQTMVAICDEILTGSSVKWACEKHNVTMATFRGRILKRDCKDKIISPEEMIELCRDFLSPEEKLLRDLIEPKLYNNESSILAGISYPKDFTSTLSAILDEIADDRSKEIFKLYYLCDESPENIGKQYKISAERVRQIVKQLLNRLRRNDILIRLLYGDDKYSLINGTPSSTITDMIVENINSSEVVATSVNKNYSIDSLDLSPRTYNALKRYNLEYISQILTLSDDYLLSLSYFGASCLADLDKCLAAQGYKRQPSK